MPQVAEELTAKDVIRAHARDELGALNLHLPPCSCTATTELPSPWPAFQLRSVWLAE